MSKIYMKDEDFEKIMKEMDKATKKAEEFISVVDVMQATSTAISANYENGKVDFTEEQMIQFIARSNKLDRILLPFVREVSKNM